MIPIDLANNQTPQHQKEGVDALRQLAALSTSRPVWLRVGKLFDGSGESVLEDADVVFDAKEILAVGDSTNTIDLPAELSDLAQPDLHLPSWTALPCLIESHAHLFLEGSPTDFAMRKQYLQQTPEVLLQRAEERMPTLARCGVGAIRDAGDKHGVGLALAAAAKQRRGSLATTPWIDSPGAAIHHQGRYGAFMGRPLEEFDSAAECVAGRVAEGADRIKLLVSGIINFKAGRVTAPPQMPTAEVAEIVKAAKASSRQTFAHASGTDGVENAIEGGVDTVEHGFFITDDQLARMRDRQIGWVPTFAPVQLQVDRAEQFGWDATVVGHLQKILDEHSKMLCRAHQMGVTIIAGSDAGSCGVPHGIGLLNEMSLMERAGLPAIDVLRAATGRSAGRLDFAEPVGRVAHGFRARLILTQNDPTTTVANLHKPKAVLFDGTLLFSDDSAEMSGL